MMTPPTYEALAAVIRQLALADWHEHDEDVYHDADSKECPICIVREFHKQLDPSERWGDVYAKLQELKQHAEDVAYRRGHHLRDQYVRTEVTERGISALAVCQRCGMFIVIKTNPAPNEVECGGTALAQQCPPEL